ncbi:hypothetical protein P170DRAFT_352605 [Aspergillus steynii IBT 23096]|uniref:Glycosyl transferase CAP10 domain-containing protein n=1 Tax=Aspergillus steynii IBT 23096 TaxID=1392250 RepID=A0A2I2GKW2_9EURO|nr:uncharacterized protein P170DRAFT_352605 [Aspergillus steynii IBT 23096]PLB53516.1 hypothetical protein P170DRAFT_352605 [Aspergillus steynii IBT 23096]
MPYSEAASSTRWHSFLITGLSIFICLSIFRLITPDTLNGRPSGPEYLGLSGQHFHPIDRLVFAAQNRLHYLLSRQSHNVTSAADRYRLRRGRHPPPGFDQWFEFAQAHNAVVIEEFFDQIYGDLSPYWGVEPADMRRQASGFAPRITVRDHVSSTTADVENSDRLYSWHSLISTLQDYLPDMDIPVNTMDEPRVIIPWETKPRYVLKDYESQRVWSTENVISEYMPLPNPSIMQPKPYYPPIVDITPISFWEVVRLGCPSDSQPRSGSLPQIDFSNPPSELNNYLQMLQDGYVSNWPRSKDPCARPELQVLHGTFIEPNAASVTQELFPLFGGSKLSVGNEILLPSSNDWASEDVFPSRQGSELDWNLKKGTVFWRGPATGGRNREENWTGFHRHRFVSMMNASTVEQADMGRSYLNFRLPSYQHYRLAAGIEGELPEYLANHTDVAFTHLACDGVDISDPHCSYTDDYFSLAEDVPLAKQSNHKFLADLDGDSSSDRLRQLLLSTSLPIKSTVYSEWHDSRLVPWAHFIPMDSTYMDVYGIMEYLLGYGDDEGHDSTAERIALNGKRWAEKVLRKEDMQIYVYRLLLEYARVCDDRREFLGYVADLW